MDKFKLVSKFKPTGDQPEAIDALVKGVLRGDKEQTLMGVTGSGKTFTMANIIERVLLLKLSSNVLEYGTICSICTSSLNNFAIFICSPVYIHFLSNGSFPNSRHNLTLSLFNLFFTICVLYFSEYSCSVLSTSSLSFLFSAIFLLITSFAFLLFF